MAHPQMILLNILLLRHSPAPEQAEGLEGEVEDVSELESDESEDEGDDDQDGEEEDDDVDGDEDEDDKGNVSRIFENH